MKRIVFCGDSFTAGIGVNNLFTEPYTVLVTSHFGCDSINLARGGSSNYAIYLQAMYALEHLNPDLLIISPTSIDRFDIVMHGKDDPIFASANDINYHDYPPFNIAQPKHSAPLTHYFADRPEYTPRLASHNLASIDCAIQKTWVHESLVHEPLSKLKTIAEFYANIIPREMKVAMDLGLICKAYTEAKKANVKCLVIGQQHFFKSFTQEEDFVNHDWFSYAQQYPDEIQSLHASAEGHKVFSEILIDRITQNGAI